MEEKVDYLYSREPHTAFVREEQILDLDNQVESPTQKVFLANLKNAELLTLDGTGATIWDLLDNPISKGQLLEYLSEIFQEDLGVIEKPVIEFLDYLTNKGFIRFE
ncbi:MAG: PqqD family protein [Rothia sp. (in: high G+C Gram-positive bacteria)]|nr:PqqD family protein [Rothia sp. (in: high G+C Gram-positive bacteria)]